MTDALPAHSKLGASGAERWMNCAGSVALLSRLDLPPSDEKDFQREGTAGHEAAAHCLINGLDAWEIVGQTFNNTEITVAMCDAIQIYIDRCRPLITGARDQQHFVETRLARPATHPEMFGTVDFGALVDDVRPVGPSETRNEQFLDVTDLKFGEGIVVEPEHNVQMMYYAFMLIDTYFPHLADETPVRLTIVQPRAFHQQGPVREWWTTAGEIKEWVEESLVPAMKATAMDSDLDAGSWCRFCPAKLVCPLMDSLFGAAMRADPKALVTLNDDGLGRSYQYTEAVKFYLKAFQEEVYRRLSIGKVVPHTKLVYQKANRVWNATVPGPDHPQAEPVPIEVAIKHRFGADAFTKPELKSPAELEAVSPEAKKFVKEWAYTPQKGLTVALDTDKRAGVKIARPAEVFAAFVDTNGQQQEVS